MSVRDVLKVSRKTFFDPVSWIGYDSLKHYTGVLWFVLRRAFSRPRSSRVETFEVACARFQITEENIANMIARYRYYALLFLCLGIATILYDFYLLFAHHLFFSWCLGLLAAALFLAQAFKYDFWVLQLTRRTLGLTFNDWKQVRFAARAP